MLLTIMLLGGVSIGLGWACVWLLGKNQDHHCELWTAQERITILEEALRSARRTISAWGNVMTPEKDDYDLHKELDYE